MTPVPPVDKQAKSAEQLIPPSLRHRAPLQLHFSLKSGEPPPISCKRIHISEGETLVVQVMPPTDNAKVSISIEKPLHELLPVHGIVGKPYTTFYAEYTGYVDYKSFFTIPKVGRLHIAIADGIPNPPRIVVPVMVWPSFRTQLLGSSLALFGYSLFWLERKLASSSSWSDLFTSIFYEGEFVVEVFFVGLLFVIPIRLIGWAFGFMANNFIEE